MIFGKLFVKVREGEGREKGREKGREGREALIGDPINRCPINRMVTSGDPPRPLKTTYLNYVGCPLGVPGPRRHA